MGADIGTSFDAIVVGTGPGGATVARELTKRGRRVLILERGSAAPVRGHLWQYVTELLWPGRGLLVTPQLVGMVRGITLGGSSLFYYGTAFPPPIDMLRRYGVDIEADVAEAVRELPIGPLRNDMMTPIATRIMDAARGLGFAWNPLDKLMHQDRWRPEFPFGYYGDPHGVKWSARMFVEEAVAGGATLVDRAYVRRVLVEDRRTATGVEYTRDGQTLTAYAPLVIVAAGGIGTPLILRASGIHGAGYDFFFDPLSTVCGTLDDVSIQPNEIPMSAGLLMENEGYMMTDMPVERATHVMMTAQALRFDQMFKRRRTASIMIKIKDDLGGRLTDCGGIRKRLTAADRDKFEHGFA
ncbi:MAG: GMC family oxidoreductase N-terminal domain-containing protein, partial [Deltaproteobacteria bacterium]|nr:GMC family oxidoreductase N-terminal domain-containing protein [Deltaproteobacteria bacterium]